MIWVKLSNPSGTYGANAPPEAAKLTYTISDLLGRKLAGNVGVAFARPLGRVAAATNALAEQDANGQWFILKCDEVIQP